MKVVLSPRAGRDLDSQIQYLIDQQATRAARHLHSRVMTFLRLTLAKRPSIGIAVEHRDLRELWIPNTTLSSGTASRAIHLRSHACGIRRRIAIRHPENCATKLDMSQQIFVRRRRPSRPTPLSSIIL